MGRDDRLAQPFHVVEQILAAGVAQHLAEHVAEQPDVPAHPPGQLLPVGVTGRAGAAACLSQRRIAAACAAAVFVRAHRASLLERLVLILTRTAQLVAARMSSLVSPG